MNPNLSQNLYSSSSFFLFDFDVLPWIVVVLGYFLRLASIFHFKRHHQSSSPGFLTELECDHVVSLAKADLKRSAVADNDSGQSKFSKVRTDTFISKGKISFFLFSFVVVLSTRRRDFSLSPRHASPISERSWTKQTCTVHDVKPAEKKLVFYGYSWPNLIALQNLQVKGNEESFICKCHICFLCKKRPKLYCLCCPHAVCEGCVIRADGETEYISVWEKLALQVSEELAQLKDGPLLVIVTGVNPKTVGGHIYLSATASTRFFFNVDNDITQDFHKRKSSPYKCQWKWGCSTKMTRIGGKITFQTCPSAKAVGVLRYSIEVIVEDDSDASTFFIFDS
ncbi:hypothetical protein AALP_AA8G265200 [Arabis alpina]|uniref:Uncharacterized protein n=1 Tax=Arabis alpina TaxID=50452 RepID=A0A087G9L2_ARAAL|nr:hypothetical protein AALP_AA8G265200 [Arabis alpina]